MSVTDLTGATPLHYAARKQQLQRSDVSSFQQWRVGGREAGRQGGREAGRQGGREAGRQGGREAGRQGGREAGRQGGREAGRQGGREAGRQGDVSSIQHEYVCLAGHHLGRVVSWQDTVTGFTLTDRHLPMAKKN